MCWATSPWQAPALRTGAVELVNASRAKRGETVRFAEVDPPPGEPAKRAVSLAARFGVPVVFVKAKGATRMAAARVTVNGKSVIVINVDAKDAPAALVLRELVHDMPDHFRLPLIDAIKATVTPEKRPACDRWSPR